MKKLAQITVENLRKTFRVAKRRGGMWNAVKSLVHREYVTVPALDGISFSIGEGELVGYIGPNGAGKSTTVKIMGGILVPDSGRCEVLGRIPWKERVEHVRRIGVVFGQRTQLWWDVPVIDSFELLRDIYRVPPEGYGRTKDELVERLGLADLLEIPARQLSLGQRMRCELAASLLHAPRVLFLDEPTIGLDAISKLAVRDFIKELNRERNVTVILTTHDMDDIEALCARVSVIGKGSILYDGDLAGLRSSVLSERRIRVDFARKPVDTAINFVRVIKSEGEHVELAFDPAAISASTLVRELAARGEIKDFMVEDPPIEEVIARMYGEWGR